MDKNERLNLRLLVLVLILEGLQILILSSVVLSFIPINTHKVLFELLDKDRAGFKADWEITIYHIFVLGTLALAVFAVRALNERLRERALTRPLVEYASGSAMMLVLQAVPGLALLMNLRQERAWPLLAAIIPAALLMRIFWTEIRLLLQKTSWVKAFILAWSLAVGGALYALGGAVLTAQTILWIVGLAMAGIVFWLFVNYLRVPESGAIWQTFAWAAAQPALKTLMAYAFPIFMVLIIWVKDPEAAVAKMAFGEHFYHFDICVMAGAFASSIGNTLGVDQIAMYGLGMPVLVGWLAKFFGGPVTYVHVFITYVVICCIYFLLFYFCLRYWLKSLILTMAAIFLAIKWQMFYTMSYPMTFTYPNGSVLRCFWDIPVMVSLWAHLRTRQGRYLFAAAAFVGMSIFYIVTTGIDLIMAYGAYIAMHIVTPQTRAVFIKEGRDWVKLGGWLFLPLAAGFVFLWLACGMAVWHAPFWLDLFEYAHLYVIGLYKLAFWAGLWHGQYWNFFMACVFPLVYLASVLWVGMCFYLRKGRDEDLIVLVVSVYGLSLLHHFVSMGVVNNYYMRALPFVFVIFHWTNRAIGASAAPAQRLAAKLLVCIGAFTALWTNHLYAAHPNIFNASRNPLVDPKTAYPLPEDGRPYFFHKDAWFPEENKLPYNSLGNKDERIFWEWQVPDHQTLKALYHQEFNFSADAALIRSLTAPNQKVALISSFEIEMLIQAQRRPFFFQFPLLDSRGMNIRTLPRTNIFSIHSLRRTIADLEASKPKYIFMERIMLNRDVPQIYYSQWEELMALLEYVRSHYEPYKVGKYLVAMKRKEP